MSNASTHASTFSSAVHRETELSYVPTAQPHAGRVYLITGAAQGIGRAIAVILAKEGASLALSDINLEGLKETDRLVKEAGAKCLCSALNTLDRDAVQVVVGEAVKHFGRLDGLVNNAGVLSRVQKPIGELDLPDWDQVMGINANGVMLLMRAVLPHLGPGASVVNMASMFAFIGPELFAAYAASKAAVLGLTRVAAREYGPKGIRVNSVCPGCIDTQMLANVRKQTSITEAHQAGTAALGRLAHPAEIAHFVAFLLSDRSSFATGQNYIVDGGFTC